MSFSWHDLINALALLLILEGLLPFLSPGRLKKLYQQLSDSPEKTLRLVGLGSIVMGLLLLLLTD